MARMMQGLIIGRFEPVCNHHIDVFNYALSHVDELCIGVGRPNYEIAKNIMTSSEYVSYSAKYLFDYEAIEKTLQQELRGKNVKIAPVIDTLGSSSYANQVIESFAKKGIELDSPTVFGDNPWTFSALSNYEHHKKTLPVINRASYIRKKIAEKEDLSHVVQKLSRQDVAKIKRFENWRTWIKEGIPSKDFEHLDYINNISSY